MSNWSLVDKVAIGTCNFACVENDAQFLNAASVLLLAATVMFPLTKINASE